MTLNSVCTGIVITPLHGQIVAEMEDVEMVSFDQHSFLSNVPQSRTRTPADVARDVAFLAAKEAGSMSVGAYHLDGGMVIS
ncbi:hypothetical protein HX828_19570 [Pseudomonas yamanorum]|uniref:Uncharacterized protein n=1 Tax=Pseudomonas yamanorum TaxID=515393 RepID=A0A7Y8K6D4_9PSED|nr:hypothetical protein [Pseudomonas yamanorum]